MTIRKCRFLPLLLLPLASISAAEQEEDGVGQEPRRCINTGSVLKTRIIDDSHVVFMMRRDEMYLNALRSSCTGLARHGAFSYRIQTRSLCELEVITIIESGSVGSPLGRSCTLGLFEPVTMEDLAVRFAPLIQQRQLEDVDTADIEEIAEEDAEEPMPEE